MPFLTSADMSSKLGGEGEEEEEEISLHVKHSLLSHRDNCVFHHI